MKKLILAALLFAAILAAAPIQVSIDTTSLNGQTGTIDIQFNPGSFPAVYDPGTATITNLLITGGTLGSVAYGPDGGAIGGGTLPGPLVILNSDFLNGIGHDATFGTQLTFLVDFTGSAFTASNPPILSTLAVTLTGTDSSLSAIADLIGDSRLDTSFSSPEATFGAPVPEPATAGLIALGLGALYLSAKRSRNR